MRKYRVVFKLNDEIRDFEVETTSPSDASDDCYYEFSDEGNYEEISVIELQ